MKYRSRLDIASGILETARGGAKKTVIMYKNFLSFRQIEEYLKLLTDARMIEYVKQDKVFNTTGKGELFLKIYHELDSMLPLENMLTKVMSQ